MSESPSANVRAEAATQPLATTAGDASPPQLPLTHMERFIMMCDDPLHPMVFRVFMRFTGPVDRVQMERAFDLSAVRHPLLFSTLESGPMPCWSRMDAPPKLIWHQLDDVPEIAHIEPIDITRENGLRVQVWNGDGEFVVLLDFHHACCDGQGARQLIADWFSSYDQIVQGMEPEFGPLDESMLRERGEVRESKTIKPIGLREGLRNAYVTFRGKTSRIAAGETEIPDARASHVIERPLSIKATLQLRERMKSQGITINDLGLAVCMAGFWRFAPDAQSSEHVTVMNPIDLRMPSDRRLPAANRFGYAILRRKRSDCHDFSALVQGLHDEMTYVKNRAVGGEFVKTLAFMDSWPWLFHKVKDSRLFVPSLQFTCLGDTTRGKRYGFRIEEGEVSVGQLKLDRITGFAPHGPRMPLSVTACETNNRLSLAVRGAASSLTDSACVEYADDLLARLIEWTGHVSR